MSVLGASPRAVLEAEQKLVRAEYDKAKASRDSALAELERAQELMRIWNDSLSQYQAALAAISGPTQ